MEKEEIEELINGRPSLNWGTKLDQEDGIPTKYIGKSFYEMDHSDIKEFFEMSNIEKFKIAYWIEQYQIKKSARVSFFFGTILGVIVGVVALSLYRNIF